MNKQYFSFKKVSNDIRIEFIASYLFSSFGSDRKLFIDIRDF